jgi:hypothetical protein
VVDLHSSLFGSVPKNEEKIGVTWLTCHCVVLCKQFTVGEQTLGFRAFARVHQNACLQHNHNTHCTTTSGNFNIFFMYYIHSIFMLGIPNVAPLAKHMINPVKLGIPNLTIEIKHLLWRLEMLDDI